MKKKLAKWIGSLILISMILTSICPLAVLAEEEPSADTAAAEETVQVALPEPNGDAEEITEIAQTVASVQNEIEETMTQGIVVSADLQDAETDDPQPNKEDKEEEPSDKALPEEDAENQEPESKEETTADAIVDAMRAKYDAPKEQIAADVEEILDTLRSVNALE